MERSSPAILPAGIQDKSLPGHVASEAARSLNVTHLACARKCSPEKQQMSIYLSDRYSQIKRTLLGNRVGETCGLFFSTQYPNPAKVCPPPISDEGCDLGPNGA
jgi:hypothetical protein